MLSLKNIKKDYYVGEQTIHALNGITINFRKNEFVSILGQSGCGKTTLMNVVGGLDRATEGTIYLNGVSTSGYKETDWDDFRNQKIGFVFQSYNLIPHLSVLTNVELALTISGVGKEERETRAKRALDRVGLEGQYSKRPNQLSGGQMQRVAIARAIVNEPDILLADEPTGAIDSETSVQIMDILQELSKEKLVIMVTHNSELASTYSTRIIRILDGEIISDDNPYIIDEMPLAEENSAEISSETVGDASAETENSQIKSDGQKSEEAQSNDGIEQLSDKNEGINFEIGDELAENTCVIDEIPVQKHKRTKKKKGATMSFWTSVKLSFKNLINKRGRSIMTAVAGSIGIISMALILAVNNGFNVYIDRFEEQSMAKYPVTISSGEFSVLNTFEEFLGGDELSGDSLDLGSILGIFTGDESVREKFTEEQLVYVYGQFSGMFKAMMNKMSKDSDISVFKKHLEENFDYSLGAVRYDYSINMNIYRKPSEDKPYRRLNPLSESDTISSLLMLLGGDDEERKAAFKSTLNNFAFWDEIIAEDNVIDSQYSVLAGHLPQNMNEIVLVLDDYNQITDFDMLLLDEMGLTDLLSAMTNSEKLNEYTTSFDNILGKEYYILPTSASYVYDSASELYKSVNSFQLPSAIVTSGVKVAISGIIRTKEGVDGGCIKGVVGYTSALGDYVINDANNSAYVTAQRAEYNTYKEIMDAAAPATEKISSGTKYKDLTPEERALFDAAAFATIKNVSTGETVSPTDYDALLSSLNVRDIEKPSFIYIYPYAIGNKNKITQFIDEFNADYAAREEAADALAKENGTKKSTVTNVVDYKDDLDSIVSELNGLVSTITYILIAVALVSVLVTMLLIAIIMYISVQDRTREIGILRSLGARRLDISNIFNVETMLLGIASGIIGILLTLVLQFPANAIFKATLGIEGLLQIAWWHPIVLIFGAVFITVISGLIPATIASRKDPVIALRTE